MAATYKTPSPTCRTERETKIREKLIDLPGALTEVALLSDSYQGLFLSGEEANEANFKKNAPKYGILHFAMHGLLNTEQSDFSGLFFSENTSCDQDNLLYSYEIKQQELNAGLVVLSACETGIGKYQRGEGVVSIGRGFMYAGSPSLLMTLWVLNDQSGAYIIQQFYQNLAEGMEKDEAIRQAKITYLKNTKDNDPASHPFLWAPFVQLGDYSSIKINTKSNFFMQLKIDGLNKVGFSELGIHKYVTYLAIHLPLQRI
jgi:CHAT domain-containing protein